MKVAIASDHAGLTLRAELRSLLESRGVAVQDLGPDSAASVDYPDFASRVCKAVQDGTATLGVLVCGTGIGMSIAANKHRGIRAALCTTEFEARMTRQHNNANVLCLGERVVGLGLGRAILEAFLDTSFEGGRHENRVRKLADLENA